MSDSDIDKPLRMEAYYYGFTPTGVREIDLILSAIATAGKGCHHTSDWNEYGYPDAIQKVATAAAAELQRLRAGRAAVWTECRETCAKVAEESEHGITGGSWRRRYSLTTWHGMECSKRTENASAIRPAPVSPPSLKQDGWSSRASQMTR